MAWAKKDGSKYDLYIAGEGGVRAPEVCTGLFYGYTNMEEIDFGGNFHTDGATTMSYMFAYCSNVEELDCSDFDTSDVTKIALSKIGKVIALQGFFEFNNLLTCPN